MVEPKLLWIRRAEFPVNRVEQKMELDAYRIYLDRPKPLAEGVFPLRCLQRISFDSWLMTFQVGSVGEGFIDVWGEAVRAWSFDRPIDSVRTMIRTPQMIDADTGAEHWSFDRHCPKHEKRP